MWFGGLVRQDALGLLFLLTTDRRREGSPGEGSRQDWILTLPGEGIRVREPHPLMCPPSDLWVPLSLSTQPHPPLSTLARTWTLWLLVAESHLLTGTGQSWPMTALWGRGEPASIPIQGTPIEAWLMLQSPPASAPGPGLPGSHSFLACCSSPAL